MVSGVEFIVRKLPWPVHITREKTILKNCPEVILLINHRVWIATWFGCCCSGKF